jgi:hypothetical protein
MADTMLVMDYVFADNLLPDQLMDGDLIEIEDEFDSQIVEVISVEQFTDSETKQDTYLIQAKNEFGEIVEAAFFDWQFVKLFVLK